MLANVFEVRQNLYPVEYPSTVHRARMRWQRGRSSDHVRCDNEVYEDREQSLYHRGLRSTPERRILAQAVYRPGQRHGDQRGHRARPQKRKRDGDRHVIIPPTQQGHRETTEESAKPIGNPERSSGLAICLMLMPTESRGHAPAPGEAATRRAGTLREDS
jgi:hypothetical protein